MSITTYDMSREDAERFAQAVFHETLAELLRRKKITQQDSDSIAAAITPLLLVRESMIAKFATWLFGPKEKANQDRMQIVFVPLPPAAANNPTTP